MNPKLYYLALALMSLILAIRVGYFYFNTVKYPPGSVVVFETRLTDQPKISARGQKVSLILPNKQRVSVNFALLPLLYYGDKVKVMGKVEYFISENNKPIAYMSYPKFIVLEKGRDSNIVFRFREKMIIFFNSTLGATQSALILGITFGIKEEMPASFYADLQKTGLMHVIAASGMNITMVGGFMIGMFSLFLKRQIALIASIVGILFYTLLAGFEASIVRAAIMGILVFSAQLTGRQNTAFVGLFTAAFLMLFINPSLITDIGFQLSFLATAGLIFIRPLFMINGRLKKLIQKSVIGEDAATTITAQMATLPILLANFGVYTFSSIAVNAIVLWTVPIIMIIGGLSAVIGLIFNPFGKLIAYLSLPFLLYFEKIVEVFARFGGQIQIKTLPFSLIAGYYLILLALILYIYRKGDSV